MDQDENVDILQDVDILQVEDILRAMDIPQDVDIAENWLTNSTRTLKYFGHVNTSLIEELERTWRGQFVEGMVPGKKKARSITTKINTEHQLHLRDELA